MKTELLEIELIVHVFIIVYFKHNKTFISSCFYKKINMSIQKLTKQMQ